ncbi:hypothetical protein JCM8547_008880 [Rhodosporidiobolus lusitaniae]
MNLTSVLTLFTSLHTPSLSSLTLAVLACESEEPETDDDTRDELAQLSSRVAENRKTLEEVHLRQVEGEVSECWPAGMTAFFRSRLTLDSVKATVEKHWSERLDVDVNETRENGLKAVEEMLEWVGEKVDELRRRNVDPTAEIETLLNTLDGLYKLRAVEEKRL